MIEISYINLTIGMLIVPNPDLFMLGGRYSVEEKREDGSFYCKRYNCGIRSEYNNYDWIVDAKTTDILYAKEGETLESWRKNSMSYNKLTHTTIDGIVSKR